MINLLNRSVYSVGKTKILVYVYSYVGFSPVLIYFTDEQRKAVKDAVGSPSQRASLTLQDYLYSVMAGFTSPQVLSLLQNQGQGRDAQLKQLILSSIGKSCVKLCIKSFWGVFGFIVFSLYLVELGFNIKYLSI